MKKSFDININNENVEVIIIRKNNKNMYLRIKSDLKIYITCNYLYSDKQILKFIENNKPYIIKMLERQKNINDKDNYFIYLGNKYEIVLCEEFKTITFDNNKVFVKSNSLLDKYIKNNAVGIFNERLKINYDKMKMSKNMPLLVIKKMKAKWGYYNKSKNTICLNLNLISYTIDDIDYVIVHELSHMIHFNHSKDFWKLVESTKSDYKINKKHLKE